MSLTALLFLVTYVSSLAMALFSHPRWGLYTYIAVFYLHPPIRWWAASLPGWMRWSLLAAVVTLMALPQIKPPANATPIGTATIFKLLVAYVLWMWIQVLWASPWHFTDLMLMSKYVLLFYVIYRVVVHKKALVEFALLHVAGCFYFGLLTLDAGGAGRLEEIGGPGAADSNTLGMHVSTSLFFAGSLILSQRGWIRWLVILTVPVLANVVIQTESRGAFLGAACGGLVYYYFAPKVHRKYIISLGTIAVFILLAYAPAVYWERIASIGAATNEEQELDHSASSRIVIIKAQFAMFKDYPFGLGARTTVYLSRQYLDVDFLTARSGKDVKTQGTRASHSTMMSILTDQGIPGIIIAALGIIAAFRVMNELRKIELSGEDHTLALMRACICASLTCAFIAGLFTNYLRAEIQLWCLALLLALLSIARAQAAEFVPAKPVAGEERLIS